MSAIPIAVAGAAGRMGRRLIALAAEHGCSVVGGLEAATSPVVGRPLSELVPGSPVGAEVALTTDVRSALNGSKVLVDFALAQGFSDRVAAAADVGVAVVSGVTGLGPDDQQALDRAAQHVPVLWAPNMSQGIAALLDLVARATAALPDFEIEVHELHHHHKADAPSGTAVALAERAAQTRGDAARALLCRGRDPGPRTAQEIGVVATRGGDTIGEHTVYLFGSGERIELCHRALNRDIFAHGALRAAGWIVERAAGRYTMQDLVGSGADTR